MYNETYDEYIRSILGYSANNSYSNNFEAYDNINNIYQNSTNYELEECYPEIYKIVYPMIKVKCDNFRGNITNDQIENMTDEIYFALDSSETVENRSTNTTSVTNIGKTTVDKKVETKINDKEIEHRETRQINRSLRDLIQILLIRELLNRPGRPPFRPRPPMPGPGPRPPMRPPFRPGPGGTIFSRELETSGYDIFEY